MTQQYTKLADALDEIPHSHANREAARILRAAAAVDVQGLMDLADEFAGAESIANSDCHTSRENVEACELEAAKARAALESALRLELAAREGWQPIETATEQDGLVMVYTPPQPGDWPDTVNITFDFICPDYEDWCHHSEAREHYLAVGGANACGPDVECTGPGEKAPYTHWMRLPAAPKGTPPHQGDAKEALK